MMFLPEVLFCFAVGASREWFLRFFPDRVLELLTDGLLTDRVLELLTEFDSEDEW